MDWLTISLFGIIAGFGLWMAFLKSKIGKSNWVLWGRWILFLVLLGVGLML